MSYRNMIVCLDDSSHSRQRLEFALELAARHDAHLTGLHLSYMPSAPYLAYDGIEPLFVRLEEDLARRQADAREQFEAAARQAGIGSHWLAARSVDMNAIIGYCHVSDLVIAGQLDPDDMASYIGEGFPGRFILGVGRPVLMVPAAGPLKSRFDNIVVGWNDSRESARALCDALPLLKAAGQVKVLSVRPASWLGTGAVPAPALGAFLDRHGVKAEIIENRSHDEPGEWLLARANDIEMQADLVVAGAYGHSRLTELVLGGVTRTLLDGMDVPVLMSH